MRLIKASLFSTLLFTSGFPQISASGYLAAPVGKFASSTDGLAETSFGLALSASRSIMDSLFLGVEGNLIVNPIDDAAFADAILEGAGGGSASVSGGTYINIPIFGTITYRVPLAGSNSFALLGGIGYDFLRMTDIEMELNGEDFSIEFDPGGALAFSVGGVIGIGNLFVGAKYMGLGEHKVKSTLRGEAGSETTTGDQEIAVVSVLAGVNF